MIVAITPLRSPLRDLHFMRNPSLWEQWPFLPLVRRQPNGRTDYGVLFDALAACNKTGFRATVFLCNLFMLPPKLDAFLAQPREVFDTFDELVAAGWRVD